MQLLYTPTIALMGIYPRETKTHVHVRTHTLTHTHTLIHNNSKLKTTIKKEQPLIHKMTSPNFLRIIMSEKQKNTYSVILLIQHSQKDKITEMEERFVVSGG